MRGEETTNQSRRVESNGRQQHAGITKKDSAKTDAEQSQSALVHAVALATKSMRAIIVKKKNISPVVQQ